MKKLSYKWTLLILSVFTILIWFYSFPIKLPFEWYDILFEGLYLFTIIISYFFIMRLYVEVLEIRWSIFTYGFLIDLLYEFTREPDFLNTYVEGVLKTSGLALIAIGLYLSQKKLRDELAKSRRTEEALRDSEEELKAIFNDVRDGIALVDMTGKVTKINKRLIEVGGYTEEEIIRKQFDLLEMFTPQSIAKMLSAFTEAISGQTVPPYEVEAYTKAGEKKNVEIHGSLLRKRGQAVGVVVVMRDITERVRAEEALRESEKRFRLLAENAQDLIYRYQFTPTRGFEYVSPSATAITGYTPEEHYADPDLGLKIVHPEDRPLLESYFQGGGVFRRPIALRWLRKDGMIIWTEQRNVPICDGAGNLVAMEGIARDITERKRMEEEREKLILELQEALANVKTLSGLLPICASCKKIRDDEGYWHQVEEYISEHSEVVFTHGICPDCLKKLYPEFYEKDEKQKK